MGGVPMYRHIVYGTHQCTAHIGPLLDQYVPPVPSGTLRYDEPCLFSYIYCILMPLKDAVLVYDRTWSAFLMSMLIYVSLY